MKNIFAKCLCLSIVTFFAINGYAKEPLQPVTVQLNWVPNVQFAGILVAKEKGWYEEAGLTCRDSNTDMISTADSML